MASSGPQSMNTQHFIPLALVSLLGSTLACDLFPVSDDRDDMDSGMEGTDGRDDDDDDDARGDDDDDDDDDDRDSDTGGADDSNTGEPDPDGTGTPPGGLSCPELDACYGGCDTEACLQACYDMATPEAQALDDALYNCAIAYGCTDVACVQINCSAELEACFGTVDPPPTTDSGGDACADAGGFQSGFCLETCTGAFSPDPTACAAGWSCDVSGYCVHDSIPNCLSCPLGG